MEPGSTTSHPHQMACSWRERLSEVSPRGREPGRRLAKFLRRGACGSHEDSAADAGCGPGQDRPSNRDADRTVARPLILEASGLGKVDAEPVASLLVPAGHFGRGVAGARGTVGEEREAFGSGEVKADAAFSDRRLHPAGHMPVRQPLVEGPSRSLQPFRGLMYRAIEGMVGWIRSMVGGRGRIAVVPRWYPVGFRHAGEPIAVASDKARLSGSGEFGGVGRFGA